MTFCCERAKAAQKLWQKWRLTLWYPYCSLFSSSERWSSPWSTGKGLCHLLLGLTSPLFAQALLLGAVLPSLISTGPVLAHSAAALENLSAERSCQSAWPRLERGLDTHRDCFRRSICQLIPCTVHNLTNGGKTIPEKNPISYKHSP